MTKGKVKKKKRLRIRHILVIAFAIYISSTLISQKNMMDKLETKKIETEKEVEVFQSELKEINDEIKNSDSLEFIEKTAREEFNMVKPREIIYIDKNKYKDPFLKKSRN